MFPQQKVVTPYGLGRVVEVRQSDFVVEPVTWRLAAGQKPIFYLNPIDVKPAFKVGDSVRSAFGLGEIKDFHGDRNIYVVTLNHWQLADGKSSTLFLNDDSMTVEGPSAAEKERLATEARIEDMLQKVAVLKEAGRALYAQKKFEEAKVEYTNVMENLRLLGDNIHGLQRAKFLDFCVTSHSNLALCSWNLSNWIDTITFANNSLSLLDALEGKMNNSELWTSLVQLGYTEDKLFDLKLKAYRIRGKAEMKRGNFDDAKVNFETALKLSRTAQATKELDDLLMDVVKRRTSEKKKEKALWQKAFNKRDQETEEPELPSSPPKGPTKPSPPKSTGPAKGTIATKSSFSYFSALLGAGVCGALMFWYLRKRH